MYFSRYPVKSVGNTCTLCVEWQRWRFFEFLGITFRRSKTDGVGKDRARRRCGILKICFGKARFPNFDWHAGPLGEKNYWNTFLYKITLSRVSTLPARKQNEECFDEPHWDDDRFFWGQNSCKPSVKSDFSRPLMNDLRLLASSSCVPYIIEPSM